MKILRLVVGGVADGLADLAGGDGQRGGADVVDLVAGRVEEGDAVFDVDLLLDHVPHRDGDVQDAVFVAGAAGVADAGVESQAVAPHGEPGDVGGFAAAG